MATIGPLLDSLLTRYGLEDLKDWAQQMAITGSSEDEILLSLYDQPALHARYPWIKQRQAAGLGPMTIEEGLAYEQYARQTAKQFGLNITNEEIWANIAGDVSTNELGERIEMASNAVNMMSPMVRAQIEILHGISEEDLIRSWLNPKEQAPTLRRRFATAQIAAGAMTAGYGQLSTEQANRLFENAFDPEKAGEAFGNLVNMQQLFQATDTTEADISRDEQLGLLTGETDTLAEIQRRAQRRTGYFQQGGQLATGRTGVGGLGTASTA